MDHDQSGSHISMDIPRKYSQKTRPGYDYQFAMENGPFMDGLPNLIACIVV